MALCYLDRSFCDSDCVNELCFRNLTPEHQERAIKLDLLVSRADFRTGCSQYQSPWEDGDDSE
jgi:hypothetical protein